jgi:23S rRNA (cytosine1962-C5)-methyltransferase
MRHGLCFFWKMTAGILHRHFSGRMFTPDQYALLEFGNETKTERFGGVMVRRETKSAGLANLVSPDHTFRQFDNQNCPVASREADGHQRQSSELTYRLSPHRSDKGAWAQTSHFKLPDPWTIWHRHKCFELKPTPAGQVGIFPEQAGNWEWIETKCKPTTGLKGLNLFAYTGGTTMSLVSRGVSMVHLDASASVVKWARRNAERSNLQRAPIRWIVDDALKFVAREFRRGSEYDVLIADPPSYGKGPKGESWKLIDQFESLIEGLSSIASRKLSILMISCHTAGFPTEQLLELIGRRFDLSHGKIESLGLNLSALNGRQLSCGHCVRFLSDELRE